jgi:hypothetical protein
MRKYPSTKAVLGATLALGLVLSPLSALADGNVIQLRPLQDKAGYTNAYTPDTTATTNNNAGSTGSASAYDYYYNNNAYGNANGSPDAVATSAADANTLHGRVVSVPKGTLLSVHLDHPVSASSAHVGDPVTATLENDVYAGDTVAIPAGSQVLGQVASVNEPGHMGRHGEIDVRFDTAKLPDGRVLTIPAHIVTQDQTGMLKGDTYTKDVLKGTGIALGATGAGTLMGTAAGGLIGSVGGGALFGLGIGALGGMGYALARKGKDVIVSAGSRMSLMVDTPVTINN